MNSVVFSLQDFDFDGWECFQFKKEIKDIIYVQGVSYGNPELLVNEKFFNLKREEVVNLVDDVEKEIFRINDLIQKRNNKIKELYDKLNFILNAAIKNDFSKDFIKFYKTALKKLPHVYYLIKPYKISHKDKQDFFVDYLKGLVYMYDLYKRQTEYNEKLKEKNEKLIKLSMELAYTKYSNEKTKEGTLINNLPIAEIIPCIRQLEKQEYINKNYPNGTEISIKFCDYCNDWTVGENRCSCGNRRVELIVDGNIIDGFFAYAEPY